MTAKGISRLKAAVIRVEKAIVRTAVGLLGGAGALIALVLVIGGAAAVVGTPFGVFWSGQDADAQSVPQAVAQINTEFTAKINQTQEEHPTDSMMIHRIPSGGSDLSITNWTDIVAVFAVKTAGAGTDAIDVVTIDLERIDLLRTIFWDMNTVLYSVETVGKDPSFSKGALCDMMNLDRVNAYLARVEQSEQVTFRPVSEKLKVGVDLGTAYIVLVVLDEENNPVACEKQAASVLRDGVVVDYTGALRIVRELKEKLEARLGTELVNCAIAMPAGTGSSARTHQYVAEGAGLEVTVTLDEPSAANAIYEIEDGVVVDIGGGTTGLAVLKEGQVVQTEDEPTGGTHLSLVLAGNYRIPYAEAEAIKQDYKRHREILPIVRPVIEKMASIVSRYVKPGETDAIYLCGGTCCLTGIEGIFEKETGIRTIKPANPFLVTPTGIAMNCKI